jgi:hypothetical protein
MVDNTVHSYPDPYHVPNICKPKNRFRILGIIQTTIRAEILMLEEGLYAYTAKPLMNTRTLRRNKFSALYLILIVA